MRKVPRLNDLKSPNLRKYEVTYDCLTPGLWYGQNPLIYF